MKHLHKILFLLLATALVFPLQGFAETHTRDSWYIGFGLGAGIDAKYTVKNGPTVNFDDQFTGADSKSPKIALNFKVGKTLSPKWLLGFDATAVGQTAKYPGADAQLQINNYFLMLTYFPNEEGLFFRLGGGLSALYSKSSLVTDTYSGYGALAGLGYAFWLGKGFNLTLNADYSMQKYSGDSGKPESSQFIIGYLGFDWY